MRVIERGKVVDDVWRRVDDSEQLPVESPVIVPLAQKP